MFTILLALAMVNPGLNHSPVIAEAASISLNKTNLKLIVGNTYTLKVNGTTKKGRWFVGFKNIATVDSNGKVTALRAGTTEIALYLNNKVYVCKLTVTDPVLSHKSINMDINDTVTLQLKGTKAKIDWKSDAPLIASVNSKGKVTAKIISSHISRLLRL